ncbi:hypothetical protein HID58_046805 [Brassica napus]|uniref:Secreted protein n=1 Tax=Brassica napus TaxID=3708 RepID=A0ABQ8AXJ3_BRANA|nr:hypothetical protein HID58_046805 [Brassica napus]
MVYKASHDWLCSGVASFIWWTTGFWLRGPHLFYEVGPPALGSGDHAFLCGVGPPAFGSASQHPLMFDGELNFFFTSRRWKIKQCGWVFTSKLTSRLLCTGSCFRYGSGGSPISRPSVMLLPVLCGGVSALGHVTFEWRCYDACSSLVKASTRISYGF